MRKHLPIIIYGAIIIACGIFLVLSNNSNYRSNQLVLGISLTLGALFAFIASLMRNKKVQVAYHEMHSLAFIIFGLSILLFANTLERLVSYTTLLFIFYAFSEIIFCNWLFNLVKEVFIRIIILRIAIALIVGIGAVVAMYFEESSLMIFGVLFVLVGSNVILYLPVMKQQPIQEATSEPAL